MMPLPLENGLRSDQVVLVLSAHCDDAPLGCGGLLRKLAALSNTPQLVGVVFTGGPDRLREEQAAAGLFGLHYRETRNYYDTLLPNHWADVKDDLQSVRESIGAKNIGLVLCPRLEDRHQDHRIVAENVWRIFRDHLILEYEIHKYEADLASPNFYVRLSEEEAQAKVDSLFEAYQSRRIHHWWTRDVLLSLMRVRGVECNAPFAEGFIARKMVW